MSERKDTKKDAILMLFMFRGDYLLDNLGHEVINLFKADNKKHYVYVVPWGHVNPKFAQRIGTILFAQHIGKGRIEVFAKATVADGPFEGVTYSSPRKGPNPKLPIMKEQQKKVCENIFYGGKNIINIYGYDKPDDDQGILVSYEVTNFLRATTEIKFSYIDNDNGYEYIDTNKANSTQRTYFSSDHQAGGYKRLIEKIKNHSLWEEEDSSETVGEMLQRLQKPLFLSIVKKGNDEIIYSNWMHYYLSKNKKLTKDFASKVLHFDELDQEHCDCFREAEHIDLLIADRKNIIIIENKIKSGINGKKENGESQLSVYIKKAEEKIADDLRIRKPIVRGFILVPDYEYDNIDSERKNLECGEKYTVIKYSAVYAFFNDFLNVKKNDKDYPYLEDFCNALERHIKYPPNDLYEDCLNSFLKITQLP
ncbi:MAG: PD-(D/E)XK nuclease family protein [Lentisphaeria bacterium]|nr:PD-(D/E)XK nuclease family protein [Lentisphaeria bacterium]